MLLKTFVYRFVHRRVFPALLSVNLGELQGPKVVCVKHWTAPAGCSPKQLHQFASLVTYEDSSFSTSSNSGYHLFDYSYPGGVTFWLFVVLISISPSD